MNRFSFPALRPSRSQGLALSVGLAGVVLLSACTSVAQPSAPAPAAAPTSASSPAVVGANPTSAPSVASSGETGGTTTPATQKVNANTASQAEVAQALTANGVPNASRWAVEVVEYRPYPTDDPSLAKLRQELAKYNPAPGVTDEIVASLTV